MAEHKETTTIPGLTAERVKAIALLIVQLYSIAQTGLSLAGISQLPFTTDQVSTAITGVIAVATSIYAWWRNNNVTEAAFAGSQLTRSIKNGDIDTVQGTSAAPDVKPVDDTSLYARDENGDVIYDPLTNTPVINVE
ncbi:hypothetical protein CSQ85_00105 [Bifidobacterium rousetti]|uniref:phage holin n=1 Tax=Bifidobacterium rousetti TaxID=2045439 RepID=UPI00123A3F7C|nr:phage holin [Bifidobacterium rousetti]KAA8820254.1 hypothetical protein CSQ85_00105 [Bifidobacterium rousetti]